MIQRAVAVLSAFVLVGSVQAMPLSSLLSSADAVVLGTQTAATQAGTTVTFILKVERVFKGSLPPGGNVTVTWMNANTGLPDGTPSQTGIWFLKQGPNGSWICLPAGSQGGVTFFPELSLPVSAASLPSGLVYDPKSTSVTDQILLETAAGPVRQNPRLLFDITADIGTPGALQALRYATASGTHDQMIAAVAGLVRAGDVASLASVEQLCSSLTVGAPGTDLIASAVGINYRNTDSAGIATLGRIATSSTASPVIQQAAAQALSAIHSQTSVPWLGMLVESTSPQMQLFGAQGLSYFANGVGIATAQTIPTLQHLNQRQPSPYRTAETDQNIGYKKGDPAPFVQYWRNWWESHPDLHTLSVP